MASQAGAPYSLDMASDLKSPRSARTEAKRDRIIECAMRHFAEHGYAGAKVEDLASELAIAKGSIFQHFGSKSGLFFECYKRAAFAMPAWLEAPKATLDRGFFTTITYWLERTEHLIKEDWVPNRVLLIGNYGTELKLKRELNRFLVSEDPYGTLEFVEWGMRRHEIRPEIDLELVVSMLDWLAERFQDALVTEELDPGLFHRHKDRGERQEARILQFTDVLQRAIGADPLRSGAVKRPRPPR